LNLAGGRVSAINNDSNHIYAAIISIMAIHINREKNFKISFKKIKNSYEHVQ
jgi:hypothetical protein